MSERSEKKVEITEEDMREINAGLRAARHGDEEGVRQTRHRNGTGGTLERNIDVTE